MPDPRTSKETLINVAKNLGSLAGRNLNSYAKIMLALETAKTSLVQAAGRDPVASRMTRIERGKTQTVKLFYKSAPDFNENLSSINGALGELAKSEQPRSEPRTYASEPRTYADLATRFGGAKQEVENITQRRKQLAEAVTHYITSKDQLSAEIKNALAKGIPLSTIKNRMEGLEQTQKTLVKSIKELIREEKQTYKTLYSLHTDAFNSVPLEARGSVTPPKGRQLR